MNRDETLHRLLLRVPNRRRLYEAIVARPGSHARQLSRDLDMALGVVEHHVRVLTKHGVLFALRSSRRRCLFASGQISHDDAWLLHGLRKPSWEAVVRSLLDRERNVSEIAKRLGEPPTTTSYTLRQMRHADILEHLRVGRESLYMLRDPEAVARVLARYMEPVAFDGTFQALRERAADVAHDVPSRPAAVLDTPPSTDVPPGSGPGDATDRGAQADEADDSAAAWRLIDV